MTTTNADVSFMTSYFDGQISKQEMLSNFSFEEFIDEDEPNVNNYKSFVQNLGKLTWVISRYYNTSNDENKKIIIELVNIYLVHYYNHFKVISDKLEPTSSGDNEISANESRYNQIIDSLGIFIVRIYYKLKYYELKDLPSGELYAYVTMEENIQSNCSLKDEYALNFNALAEESSNSDEILQITRGTLNNAIRQLQNGAYREVYSILSSVLETNDHMKSISESSKTDNKTDDKPETAEIVKEVTMVEDNTPKAKDVDNKKSEQEDDDFEDEVSALIDDYFDDKPINSAIIDQIKDIDVELDINDMSDIGVKIINDEEAEKIIKENLKTMSKARNETNEQMEVSDTENTEDTDTLPEDYLSTNDIVKTHFDRAWETDIETQMKVTSRFIADNVNSESNEELKKIKKYETRYTLYILSFLRAEQFI